MIATPPRRSLTVAAMSCLLLAAAVVAASTAIAHAQPAGSWTDTPALVAAATAPIDDAVRACLGTPGPHRIGLVATRARDGHTAVAMPFPHVGHRGLSKPERCLGAVVAGVDLPPLPDGLERVVLGHVVTAPGAAPPAVEPAFAAWRDPAATIATSIDAARRATLAACDARPRTIRLVVDRRRDATRIWLPAWQFHSARRDGTTPPAQRRVKTCVARAIRGWQLPLLPRALGELQLAVPVAP